MWQPSEHVLADALSDAAARAPDECCGLVIEGAYVPMRNVSPQPRMSFLIDSREMLDRRRAGGLEAVVHSHCYAPPSASDADRTSCEASALPWLIVSFPLRTYHVIQPCGYRAPLVGRQWAWRVHDCFGLIRDGLIEYAGIEIEDIDRDWGFWKHGGHDIVAENYERLGFVKLPKDTKPRHLDLFVLNIHGKVPNHLALFIAPDRILHHGVNKLSKMEIYGGVWQQLTEVHLRHRDLVSDGREMVTP
jgi:proteasome lid subunit RPN8/RPN11